jgi:uncharacterized protein YigE (DUF2233 family)
VTSRQALAPKSRAGRSAIAVIVVVLQAALADEPRTSTWTALVPGLWYREWSIQTSADQTGATGHVFRVDPRAVRMTVVDARRESRQVATAQVLREESHAYVVVNGGFFDENHKPLGLLVSDGHEISPLRRVDQGVFLISLGKPTIQHSRDPLPSPIETALQSGPRLIVDGHVLPLKPKADRRTSVCLPGDGTVMVVVVPDPILLSDLAENLARSSADGGLGCWSALNLDGGPSTQLSADISPLTLEVAGGWGVPNGLAIFPKSAAPSPTTP